MHLEVSLRTCQTYIYNGVFLQRSVTGISPVLTKNFTTDVWEGPKYTYLHVLIKITVLEKWRGVGLDV